MHRLLDEARRGRGKRGFRGRAAVAVAFVLAVVASAQLSAQSADGGFAISTVSTRADSVTGGDVLLHVAVPGGAALDGHRVMLNGTDVTSVFRRDDAGHALTGLVTGLTLGPNTVSVGGSNAGGAELTIMNHPIVGPVFSGPHEQPFMCETEQFELQSGETLGAALDEHCSIDRRVDYYYRSTDGGDLMPLPESGTPPDLAEVTVPRWRDSALHRPDRNGDDQSRRFTRSRSCTIRPRNPRQISPVHPTDGTAVCCTHSEVGASRAGTVRGPPQPMWSMMPICSAATRSRRPRSMSAGTTATTIHSPPRR